MSIVVDTPLWPGPRGWLFAHLASDTSYEELHTFARQLGLDPRAFDRDHYDLPEHLHARALRMGAEHVPPRELVARLRAAGLRRPKAVLSTSGGRPR
ncbi:DUF4031 domain-containing protein [Nocardiopsis kunsanensis]|uniref:DUF4031 domain-containing protein n=1 Tax=Nocardiopsis kunsanensis TaxID=141693 RepID=A0A919CE97_9ACTN|nr:DUF4031 domain-containing protein [Nocardiopsis kunsanensis]GHD14917.1 hypothetical protein GCM10007147_01470 [Nocardiopsis kunsanensis]